MANINLSFMVPHESAANEASSPPKIYANRSSTSVSSGMTSSTGRGRTDPLKTQCGVDHAKGLMFNSHKSLSEAS